MRAALVSLTVLAAAAFAPAASAQTVTGTFDPSVSGPYLDVYVPFGGAGKFDVSFDLSRPASDVALLEAGYTYTYNWHDVATGQYLGGDDQTIRDDIFVDPPGTHGALQIDVPAAYHKTVYYFPTGPAYEDGFYYNTYAWLDVRYDDTAPVDFKVSVNFVPEPAAWALMISGFAFAGVALRRRRAVSAAA